MHAARRRARIAAADGAVCTPTGTLCTKRRPRYLLLRVPSPTGSRPEPTERRMTARLLTMSALFILFGATASMAHADDAVGIVADPCATEKTPGQLPEGQWGAYILTRDFGRLCQYRAKNTELAKSGMSPRVVFMGDSITEFWDRQDPSFFTHADAAALSPGRDRA